MTDKPSADPLELFQISQDLLAAQRKFLPSSHIYADVADTVRTVTQANITYCQALMRANAALLAALWQRPLAANTLQRPSDAAHTPDTNAP